MRILAFAALHISHKLTAIREGAKTREATVDELYNYY